jgi:hypothetical protein
MIDTAWFVPKPNGLEYVPGAAKVVVCGGCNGVDAAVAAAAVVVRENQRASPEPAEASIFVKVNPCSVVCAAISVCAVPPVVMVPEQSVGVTLVAVVIGCAVAPALVLV